MSHFPSELFPEILSRLPAQSLLRFRAVCKSWRSIIDDPSFIRSHAIAKHSPTNILFRNSNGTRLFSFPWDSLRYHTCMTSCQRIQVTPVKVLACQGIPRLTRLPVASCNGLFLIFNDELKKKSWAVWNPLTREFHVVPEPNPKVSFSLAGSGLGYDPVGDDYKVVRIYMLGNGKGYGTLFYSLKENSWKKIQDSPTVRGWHWHGYGLYLNGSLYWITMDSILALNVSMEEYRVLPLPPGPVEEIKFGSRGLSDLRVSVLDGYLAFSYTTVRQGFSVWVMKGEEKWTKLFPPPGQPAFRKDRLFNARPIAYWESKGELVFQGGDLFYWWNSFKGIINQVFIPQLFKREYSAQIWPASLFHLDDHVSVSGGSLAAGKRKRKRKRVKEYMLKAYVMDEDEDYFECYMDYGKVDSDQYYDTDWYEDYGKVDSDQYYDTDW